MTDAAEAIAHVRRHCEMPYPDNYSGSYGFGTMRTILAHIDAQAAEIDALQIACRDAHTAEAEAMAVLLGCEERVERQAAEITALRAAASKLVALAESGGVTGTTIADRVRVDALIGKLRDAMKGPQ